MIRIAEKDLTPDVFKLMLQDDEPATILFNNTQRGFRVNQPLQVSITEQQELFIRFYSPRPVKEVTVWATISGYEEAFQLAKFDVLPAFTEFHKELPMLTQSKRYITRSGKEIQIMANPHLSAADFKLEIECKRQILSKTAFHQIQIQRTFLRLQSDRFMGLSALSRPCPGSGSNDAELRLYVLLTGICRRTGEIQRQTA